MDRMNNETNILVKRKTKNKIDVLEEFLKTKNRSDTIEILINYYLSSHQIQFREWFAEFMCYSKKNISLRRFLE